MPYVGPGESEQSERAARLARRLTGIAVVSEAELSPAHLAAAVDRVASLPRPDTSGIDLAGARRSAALIEAELEKRA